MTFQMNSNTNKSYKKKPSSGRKLNVSSTISSTAAFDVPMEQNRRSSLASSNADSMDYQQSNNLSPMQRRASGPSNNSSISSNIGGSSQNKNIIANLLPATPPLFQRVDSWGDLSISDV